MPLRGLFAVGLVDVGDHDIHAVAGKRLGDRLSHQRRAAGDDCGFAV